MSNSDPIDFDEIRKQASKNWLSAASVSLAKLDEVKAAKVYNIGLADAKSLKPAAAATRNKDGVSKTKSTRWASAAGPPLSGLSMQHNAWGSSATLPIEAMNIRDECSKQTHRTRPESAKTISAKQPNGGKFNRRPQSAVINKAKPNVNKGSGDCVLEEDFDFEIQSDLGVLGAKFRPEERPDNFSVHSTSHGYVAPVSNLPHSQISPEKAYALDMMDDVVLIPGVDEHNTPQAPRSSPELGEMLQSDTADDVHYSDFSSDINAACDKNVEYKKQEQPKPRVPISIPNPYDSYDSSDEEELILGPMKVNITINNDIGSRSTNEDISNDSNPGDDSLMNIDYSTEKNFDSVEQENLYTKQLSDIPPANPGFSVLSEELQKEIESLKKEYKSSNKNILGNRPPSGKNFRPTSAKNVNCVKFNESRNCTVDITPRNRILTENNHGCDSLSNETNSDVPRNQKPRPYSGRRDLKHVKSKTDSGFNKLKINKNDDVPNNIPKSRPQSAKLTTLTVSFDPETEEEKPDAKSKERKSLTKLSTEVETLISKMGISEEESKQLKKSIEFQIRTSQSFKEEQERFDAELDERPGSRPGSQAKYHSSAEKNYYQLAMSAPCKKIPTEEIKPDNGEIGKEIKKTVKTLELMEGRELKEMKLVSVLGAQEYKVNEYVAPKLPSRPSSAVRPQSANKKNNTKNENVASPVKSSNQYSTGIRKTSMSSSESKNTNDHRPSLKPENMSKPPLFKSRIKPPQYVETSLSHQENRENMNGEVLLDIELEENTDPVELEERPGSRMGFRPDEFTATNKGVNGDISLKKRRITSAPVNRINHQQQPPLALTHHSTNHHHNSHLHSVNRTSPLSAKLNIDKFSSHTCSHTHTEGTRNNMSTKSKGKSKDAKAQPALVKEDSVAQIMAKPNNFSGYGNLTMNNLDSKKKLKEDAPLTIDAVDVTTRQNEFEIETDGLKECRELHEKLIDSGVQIDLTALERALLPPTEYRWVGPSYKSNITPTHPAFKATSSGLLTKPETWLKQEFRKIEDAKRKVEIATQMLEEQEREEDGTYQKKKEKKKVKKKKSTK